MWDLLGKTLEIPQLPPRLRTAKLREGHHRKGWCFRGRWRIRPGFSAPGSSRGNFGGDFRGTEGNSYLVACGPYGSKNSFASGPGLKDLEFKHMEVRIQVWWKELVGRGLDEFLTGRNLAGQRQHLLGGRCITSTNGGNSAVVSSNQLQLIHSIC